MAVKSFSFFCFEGHPNGTGVRAIPGRVRRVRAVHLRSGQQAAVRVRTVVGVVLPGPVDAHRRPVHTHRAQAVQVQTRLVPDHVLGPLPAHYVPELHQHQSHGSRGQDAR